MNIWTVDLTNNLLGFAQLPNSSTLSGLPAINGAANTDGVVIRPTSFGRTGNVTAPYNLGRSTTHEIGHWFGLIHISGDGGCSIDDFCTDTPSSDEQNYDCPTGHVSCTSVDMIENYMDYTDDACMNIFTNDQKTRMRTVLENSPRRGVLGMSNACTSSVPPLARFRASVQQVCEGNSVQFTDQSGYDPISWKWTFSGGIPATSTLENPAVVYPDTGSFDVILEVSNIHGTRTITRTAYIHVQSAGPEAFFLEDFEDGLVNWTIENPDGPDGKTWESLTVGGSVSGDKAAYVNSYFYASEGEVDGLISPLLDLTGRSQVSLSFDHAHRQFSSGDRDSLIVFASTDGGASWPHRLFADAEDGTGNFATGPMIGDAFTPGQADDWCFPARSGGSVSALI